MVTLIFSTDISSAPCIFTVFIPGVHIALFKYSRVKSSLIPPAKPVVYTQCIPSGLLVVSVPSIPKSSCKFSKTLPFKPFVIGPKATNSFIVDDLNCKTDTAGGVKSSAATSASVTISSIEHSPSSCDHSKEYSHTSISASFASAPKILLTSRSSRIISGVHLLPFEQKNPDSLSKSTVVVGWSTLKSRVPPTKFSG